MPLFFQLVCLVMPIGLRMIASVSFVFSDVLYGVTLLSFLAAFLPVLVAFLPFRRVMLAVLDVSGTFLCVMLF